VSLHEEWVRADAMRIWREHGSLERTLENVATVELACMCARADGYVKDVGAPLPAGIEKEVAAAYWEHVATNPPPPLPQENTKRARQLAAIRRFEETMGFHAPSPESESLGE
jgi:hypothetical protein